MSMSAYARAVRDAIRAHADYEDHQVNVEIDEMAPATANDTYIIVTQGTRDDGPLQATAGSVEQHTFGLDVVVALRSPKVPRDRKRDLWIALTKSFEVHERNIRSVISWKYAVMQAANTFITAEEAGTPCGFYKPLYFQGTGEIRQAPAEIYAGVPGGSEAAYIQRLRFRGAIRMEVVT